MMPKSGNRFSDKIMLKKRFRRMRTIGCSARDGQASPARTISTRL
jgi:hypothetical protein